MVAEIVPLEDLTGGDDDGIAPPLTPASPAQCAPADGAVCSQSLGSASHTV
jgi:hypothetical protein